MAFEHNPVPALTQGTLALMENLRGQLRNLKTEAYGPDANKYDDDKSRPALLISPQELLIEISKILSDTVIQQIADERRELRPRLETALHEAVIEEMFPAWMPDSTPVMYVLRVEGRNQKEMKDPKHGLHAGYTKKQTPIQVLTVGELRRDYREVLVKDEELFVNIEAYGSKDADYILSDVHKFYLAIPLDRKHRKANDGNGELILLSNGAKWGVDDSSQVHLRSKSGPESLWKTAHYLTGIEEESGRPRETILDEAGARFIAEKRYEGLSIDLHQHFARKHTVDWTGAVLLQTTRTAQSRDAGTEQKELFLRHVPRNLRKFYRRVMPTEDRSYIDLAKKDVPPYYLEMVVPINVGDGIFGRNVIDVLTYPREVFKLMYGEHGHDPFAYKARDEGWRTDHWTLMEWGVALKLTGLLDENGIRYVRDLADVRMQEARLLPKRARSYVFA